MSTPDESDRQDNTIRESWRILQDIVYTGSATLGNGTVIRPDERGFLSVLEFMARQRPPKVKRDASVRDWQAARTGVSRDAKNTDILPAPGSD